MNTEIRQAAVAGVNILLVTTDDPLAVAVTEAVMGLSNCAICVCSTIREALEYCMAGGIHVVALHHVANSRIEPIQEFCRQVHARGVRVLVVSDQHRPQDELDLGRLENVDYLERPLDLRRFSFLVRQATLRAHLRSSQRTQPSRIPDSHESLAPCLLEGCLETRRLMSQITRIAQQDAMILLMGETGTGKTRLARMIHDLSPRRDEPFVVINCGSCSSSLMNSELFGHAKGAFTGADSHRDGKLLAAGHGTVLLDDIEALPIESQVKLLRVLEKDGEFEPLGSNKTLKLNARVIAASNQPLAELAERGLFRKDLYFRVNVVEFRLPDLRNCRLAIEPLARRFAAQAAPTGVSVVVSHEAICALESYDWPGNIRELEHAIRRAVMLCFNLTITLADLPESVRKAVELNTPQVADEQFLPGGSSGYALTNLSTSLPKAESTVRTLMECGGNKTAAARKLGISREALYKRIRKIPAR